MATLCAAAKGQWRLEGDWCDAGAVNQFLAHLEARYFAPAMVRAYAYDTLNFARFCVECRVGLGGVEAAEVFDWINWQSAARRPRSGNVIKMERFAGVAPSAPSTVN